MEIYQSKIYGNPSSFHSLGLAAKNAVEGARKKVADILHASPEEIIFTGSGTESINLAIQGIAKANKRKHIITTSIEHHAVLETLKFLETQGYEITVLKTDKYGIINPQDIKSAIRTDTILVTVIFANNEIGSINPIKEIGKICREKNIYFHTDACQAFNFIEIDVEKLNVDLLTLNGSKIYGPKGTGILYIKKGTKISPIIYGGGQESGLRSGTENVPGIMGFAKALELAENNRNQEIKQLIPIQKLITKELLKIPKTMLNGHPTNRLPNNINISFLDVEGESILLHLNKYGICASTGSACSAKNLEPSHVLTAIGLKKELAHGAIRFSLGKYNAMSEAKHLIKVLPGIIKKLRVLSPIKTEALGNKVSSAIKNKIFEVN